MQQAQESERSIKRAQVSWEQSKEDLELAKSYIKTNPDTSCLLSNQAAINAFSSILQALGHFQLPAYSATEMLNLCSSVAEEVEQTRPQCEVLDSALNRDLLGHTRPKNISFTPAFAKTSFEASSQILKIIKAYWQDNKERFFTP
ncbi:MAG: hypothetical protein H8E38_06330 [SAR324 cluster bacterium]|nr:hypothetical protein [SAR324 cluster bacterium]MBL7034947.1 hypothetical protein [SAR324 cluster bacterium]